MEQQQQSSPHEDAIVQHTLEVDGVLQTIVVIPMVARHTFLKGDHDEYTGPRF